MPHSPSEYQRRYNAFYDDVNSESSMNHFNNHLSRTAKKLHKKDLGSLNDHEHESTYHHAVKTCPNIKFLKKKHFG
ncbi:MAG: hypothetical protein ACR2MS_07645 [Weeksellaceae bacterium]